MDYMEWAKLATRWVHVFAAILWIGQTHIFHLFEHGLARHGASTGGKLWLVHGGGFWVVEKRAGKLDLPPHMQWFKWESGITWISGVVLIALTHYMGGLLVDPYEQEFSHGVIAGVASIFLGWVVYDLLVMTPLSRNMTAFAVVGLGLLIGSAWALGHFLSPRSVWIHIGGLIGTIMAANVWMKIIPSQKRMIRALAAGEEPPEVLLATGPQRSKHNTFLVMPLVAVMISNHYPTISYGTSNHLLALGVVLLVGWAGAWWLARIH